MTIKLDAKNQISNKRKVDFVLSICITLILLMPVYSWFLIRLYQTQIQIPKEWNQFIQEEQQILQALQEYKNQSHIYPDSLSTLEQELPNIQPKKWSFQYELYENNEFSLSATIPKSWFDWPAKRVCQSQYNAPPTCNFHYICSYKYGIQSLMDSTIQESPSRSMFGHTNYPCTWEIQTIIP